MSIPLYDRVRAWADALPGLNTAGEFYCMVEECKELVNSYYTGPPEEYEDAIGDVQVTAIVLYHCVVKTLPGAPALIEGFTPTMPSWYDHRECTNILGHIAEGLRKPTKAMQALEGCALLLYWVQHRAEAHRHDPLKCLQDVCVILEKRLAVGYVMHNGSAIKPSDAK